MLIFILKNDAKTVYGNLINENIELNNFSKETLTPGYQPKKQNIQDENNHSNNNNNTNKNENNSLEPTSIFPSGIPRRTSSGGTLPRGYSQPKKKNLDDNKGSSNSSNITTKNQNDEINPIPTTIGEAVKEVLETGKEGLISKEEKIIINPKESETGEQTPNTESKLNSKDLEKLSHSFAEISPTHQIERYPYARFPNKVVLDDIISFGSNY